MSHTMQAAVAASFDTWYQRYHHTEQIVFSREAKRHLFDAYLAGFNAGEITGISIGRQLESIERR